jgi:Leucine-rich repeat (LRR) protein
VWEVDLSSNRLEAVPECFGQLKGLQTLDLSSNKIARVNDSINEMSELVELNLECNRELSALPDSLAAVRKLERLNLSRCGFT